MTNADESTRGQRAAITASLGAAAVFEVLDVLEAQDKAVWARSAWKQDPYHTPVFLAQFAVPLLMGLIALRLLVWREQGGADRAQQTVRACGVLTASIGLTLGFEWAALAGRANPASGGAWAAVMIAGLVATSVFAAAAATLLVRCRRPRGARAGWGQDWLGDLLYLCRAVPVLRRWATSGAVAGIRRHATIVFVALSVLAAAVLVGAQAIGEDITDPVFVIWLLGALTGGNFAFCVISNAVAGFILRPPRTRPRRIVETSIATGCLAVLTAIAFHDQLWSTIGTGPLTTGDLEAFTLGAGAATALVTSAVLFATTLRPTYRDPDGGA